MVDDKVAEEEGKEWGAVACRLHERARGSGGEQGCRSMPSEGGDERGFWAVVCSHGGQQGVGGSFCMHACTELGKQAALLFQAREDGVDRQKGDGDVLDKRAIADDVNALRWEADGCDRCAWRARLGCGGVKAKLVLGGARSFTPVLCPDDVGLGGNVHGEPCGRRVHAEPARDVEGGDVGGGGGAVQALDSKRDGPGLGCGCGRLQGVALSAVVGVCDAEQLVGG